MLKAIGGKVTFSRIPKRTYGVCVEHSEYTFLGFIIRQREMPKVGKRWEVVDYEVGRKTHSWIVSSKYTAELKAIEAFGNNAIVN